MYKSNALLRINSMKLKFLVCLIVSGCGLRATIYDNRFIPFFQRHVTWLAEEPSAFGFEAFATSGREAWGRNDRLIGVPELQGFFDLKNMADAQVAIGNTNPLPTAWQGISIPYKIRGKIQTQGITFMWHQRILDWLAFGASWSFLRANAKSRFRLLKNIEDPTNRRTNLEVGAGDELLLDSIRRQIFTTIGLQENHYANYGFGDIDIYVQFGHQWDYQLKCRMVKAGGRLGMFAPTGDTREQNSALSIPFGGNGHWGIYGQFDAICELKEDMKAGVMLQVSKRFARTRTLRVPVSGEPNIYGALVVPVCVDPGVTVVFAPYFMLENVRDGLALGVTYTLTKHAEDTWSDARSDQTIPLTLDDTIALSAWGSSYFTLNVAYDFGKMKVERSFEPILSFRWDVPFELFVTKQVVKTHRIGMGIDFVF